MKLACKLACIVGLGVISPHARAAAAGSSTASVSLEQVLEMALRQAETPRIAAGRLEQAHAAVRAAWSALLPTVTVAGTYRRRAFEVAITRERDDGTTERSVLQANDALFGEARLRSTLFEARALPDIAAAEDDVEVAQAALERSRFLLAHEVADAYLNVRVAEAVRGAARRRLDVARADSEAKGERRQAGLIANVESDRAELEAVEAEVALARAVDEATRARLTLELLAAAPVNEPLLPVQAELPMGSTKNLVQTAQVERPELLSARRALAAAEQRALAPWLDLVPTLAIDGVVNATNETGFNGRVFNWNLALTLGWTLYDGGVRYAEARRTAAERDIAQLQLAQLERSVATEVKAALASLSTSRAEAALAKRRVEVARRYAREVRVRAAQGLSGAVEAADAAVAVFEAEVSSDTAAAELARAVLLVRRAAGRWPLSDVASEPES